MKCGGATIKLQGVGDVICGHLYFHVLQGLAAGKKFEDIILLLVQQLVI